MRGKGKSTKRHGKNVLVFTKGHRLTVPNHPPEFCSRPWFPIVVAIRDVGTSLTLSNLFTALINQLGLLNGMVLNFRLMSIRVWGPIPTTNTPLVCVFTDVFDEFVSGTPVGGQMELEVVTNYADQVNRARCGFEYSSVQQAKSLFTTTGASDVLVKITGAGTGSVAYVKCLWRSYAIPSPLAGVLPRQPAVNPACPPGWTVV